MNYTTDKLMMRTHPCGMMECDDKWRCYKRCKVCSWSPSSKQQYLDSAAAASDAVVIVAYCQASSLGRLLLANHGTPVVQHITYE